jgi:hypothetical protein
MVLAIYYREAIDKKKNLLNHRGEVTANNDCQLLAGFK